MSRLRNAKRTAHQAANDKSSMEEEKNFRFLKAPKNTENQAGQLLQLDSHIRWLKIKIKTEYGDISNLVDQGSLPEISRPVPVGTPIPQVQLRTPAAGPIGPAAGTRNAQARIEEPQLMTQVEFDEIIRENREIKRTREQSMSKALGYILTTIDDAFQNYISNNPEASQAYDADDIKTIMKHLSIWYKKSLGSSSINVRATTEADIAKAKKVFNDIKQFKNQTVQAFKKIFDANLTIYLETTGEEMQQQRRAYQFISKLYMPKFGDWFDKKVKEDVDFGISNAGNPNAIQPSDSGCPKTLEIAFNLAVSEERSIDVKQRREANKQQSSDVEETNPSNLGLTSYAKENAKRKVPGNINHNTNNKSILKYKIVIAIIIAIIIY